MTDHERLPTYEQLAELGDLAELCRLRTVARTAFTSISAHRSQIKSGAVPGKPGDPLDVALGKAQNFYQGALTVIGDRLAELVGIERRVDKRVEQLLIAVAMLLDDESEENWQRLEEAFAPMKGKRHVQVPS